MFPPPESATAHAQRRWPKARLTLAAAVLCASLTGFFAGCSTQQCSDMKGNGSAFGSLLCGGEGTPAPEPASTTASLCQPRQVMPQFFSMLADPARPLDGLRQVVKVLAVPTCFKPANRACTDDSQCAVGTCDQGLCPCTAAFNPLADILQLTFRGIATISLDPAEEKAVGGKCLTAAEAAKLAPTQLNRLCELRRSLDVLLLQQGGQQLLNDPNVKATALSLIHYLEGKLDGTPHYDLFTGLGRMAQNPGVCDAHATWQLFDKALAYLTPARAQALLGSVQTLLNDPTTKNFLAQLSTNGSASGRDAIIVIANGLQPALLSARSGLALFGVVQTQLLQTLVYGSSTLPQQFKTEVADLMDNVCPLLGGVPNTARDPSDPARCAADPAGDQAGIFTPLQAVLSCAGNPVVRCADPSACTDHHNDLVGALYDILSKPQAQGGVDLATLLGAVNTLVSLDGTGQTARTLRLVIESIDSSEEATDGVRQLLAQVLTAELGRQLMPTLDAMIGRQVLGEFLSLLDDLLYSCKPPPTP